MGYLFGSGEPANNSQTTCNVEKATSNEPTPKSSVVSQPVDNTNNVPAGIHSSNTNNYLQMIPAKGSFTVLKQGNDFIKVAGKPR